MEYKDYFLIYMKYKLLYTRSTKKHEMEPHLETRKNRYDVGLWYTPLTAKFSMMMMEESFNQGVIFEQKPNILLFSLDCMPHYLITDAHMLPSCFNHIYLLFQGIYGQMCSNAFIFWTCFHMNELWCFYFSLRLLDQGCSVIVCTPHASPLSSKKNMFYLWLFPHNLLSVIWFSLRLSPYAPLIPSIKFGLVATHGDIPRQ